MEAGGLDRLMEFAVYGQRAVLLVLISFELEKVLMICCDVSF